ncbi:MAG: UDP-N-acetylmuramoyl-L-alanine--D-glutamate ligase [Rhodobiaceae bacterium]|nr:UDP-N-acetylmuramoyl-L-alanine--D-glutamate ligase [Rhodobiaceae bacterium]MCC0055673.1 UDP-N-acetylmuramoyl-L-alanine--D-glutamate ligase [Rhodobiaceae bacterium]
MITVTTFGDRTVLVFGLGRSGLSAARALRAGGAKVLTADDGADNLSAARAEGFVTVDPKDADWQAIAALILSPGVPLTHPQPHPVVRLAQKAGVPIIGDTEMFFDMRAAHHPATPVVTITGTNGKSTTTALIGHMLAHAGIDVAVGGNIGTAILDLPEMDGSRAYVVEMSSYQIDLTPGANASFAILLNLTPDHLDRHGSMENYAAVKARLIEAADMGAVSVDDDWCANIAERLSDDGHEIVRISTKTTLEDGIFCQNGIVHVAAAGQSRELLNLNGIGSLRGEHNWQNAIAAIAACLALGVPESALLPALRSFPGLAHRMEQVSMIGGVLFVNDSKATNADAAARALSSYRDIYWIAGGKAKEGGIASLSPWFDRIRKAYLIGEAATAFAKTLDGLVEVRQCGTLENAVNAAAHDAAAEGAREPVVLLSPACASFDQYRNFEIRGDAFRAAVMALNDDLRRAGTRG